MNARHMLQHGFTLMEMVIVIVITGIIGGMVAVFIHAPVQGYFDMERRTELTDTADTALRRIGRDLRLALPNSIRLSGSAATDDMAITFLLTHAGGRYHAKPPGWVLDSQDNPAAGTAATTQSSSNTTTPSFDVLGNPTLPPAGKSYVVVYNLGIGGADAYNLDNVAEISGLAGNRISLTTPRQFPFESPGQRFQIVESKVTYICTQGQLIRYWKNGINNTVPDLSGNQALVANHVSACDFTYDQLVNERSGLVTMRIALTRNNETVTLYHEVHVSNVP